jgi:hypothetical protein
MDGFSGGFDSDCHVSYNKNVHRGSVNICITQKYRKLLDELAILYNGKVYSQSKNFNSYRVVISKKTDKGLQILKDYFTKHPSRTINQNRLGLFKQIL